MTKRHLVIATRESPLALAQTELIKSALLKLHPHLSVDILGITTQADKHLDILLTEIGGKGLFVKELEEALLDGRADIAVHSMKDVPMELPPGLILPVIGKRTEPRDAFVSNQYASLAQLPAGAAVGTSSLRRQTQLRAVRSDLDLRMLRGNLNTRLKRLDQGDFDAIILAAAGLNRLHMGGRIKACLSTDESLPAAGQGALGVECREGDEAVIELIAPLNDELTYDCVTAERALCRRLGGGCKVPVAAFAECHHGKLTLRGLVANRDGTRILRARREGEREHAESMGTRVAEELLQQGAERILKEFL
jgi:hydroxymethylbilane synthase